MKIAKSLITNQQWKKIMNETKGEMPTFSTPNHIQAER